MQKRAAQVLADKVRRQLTGNPSVSAVEAIHFNAHAGAMNGWAVQVTRAPRKGGPVTIVGDDLRGYTTTDSTGSATRSLPVLLRDVFLRPDPEPAADAVRLEDEVAAELLRGAANALGDLRKLLGGVASDLATRKEQLPWVVVVLNRGIEKGPNLRVHGTYPNAVEANAALERIPEASMPLDSPAVLVSVLQLSYPEEA